ncbi:CD59 glycoprotein-like [Anabas testudineus]|uniref:CD59 glycoprotein-like n=1 Tax=Anabas testudineus TaxID=64144 RepID=UPI000E4540D7|nr:CD59 glycoprotein-like [Anabas testudineus]XP_026202811.1 CD59 glycoprotein-like [Anabas testudineus]
MMRSSVVFCLAVSFAMFGFGLSLQCYSCPHGSSSKCKVKQDCIQAEDACLKLTSGDMTYTECVTYTDCNFRTLAQRYSFSSFSFSCCQSDLCNAPKKSFWNFFS